MTTRETMTVEDAMLELQSVGARAKIWSSLSGLAAIYVNDRHGRKLDGIHISFWNLAPSQRTVEAVHVWRAVHRHITSKEV